MPRRAVTMVAIVATLLAGTRTLAAQSFPVDDPVLKRIWALGMDSTQMYPIAQALLDSIGPRLTGSPQQEQAVDWVLSRFTNWGLAARKEKYGTYRGWRRGVTHIDLVAPRVRTLEGTLFAWSVGTKKKNIEADVVLQPLATDSAKLAAWLKSAKGKFVVRGEAEPTCRPPEDWKQWALPGSKPGKQEPSPARIAVKLEELDAAGVAGLVSGPWTGGWATNRVMATGAKRVPSFSLSCEDFGLVYRLAENHQGPRIRLNADAEALGDVPVYNALGEMKGTTKAGQYVLLSAHLDSWDAASGATDNGTGSAIVMEAARILKAAYPNPKRSLLFALWNGEEQGLLGSAGFVQVNRAMLDSIHVVFNRDGEGRPAGVSGQGVKAAEKYFNTWLAKVPAELVGGVKREFPGTAGGSTDHASFIAAGVPAFSPSGSDWNYGTYTWHTNRDTFDKISIDDLKMNATLLAMLVYLASEDEVKMPRD